MTPQVGRHPGDSPAAPQRPWKCSCGVRWWAVQKEDCSKQAEDDEGDHVVTPG